MADDPDDPDLATARLEAALERIARAGVAPAPRPTAPDSTELAHRLDTLIERVRGALAPT